jgi:hypothetical protein
VSISARRQHGDAVADQHQLAQVAGHHHQGLALASQLGEQAIDVELGADVDAAVGSSNSSTWQSRSSQRPITTFCWLPPDSSPTACAGPALRNAHGVDLPFGQAVLGVASSTPARDTAPRLPRQCWR